MPNLSPFGAFAEGVAGGISRGMENYVTLAIKKIDLDQKKAAASAEMSFKIFTDENLPVEVRKRAYRTWQEVNKGWRTGIQAPDFPDEYWHNKKLTPYFKKGQAILKNKDYSPQEKMGFLRELEVEVIDALDVDTAKGLRPLQEQVRERAFTRGMGALAPGEVASPEVRGLLGLSEKGREVLAARARAREPKKPAVSMYEEKAVGDGMKQKFRWNPRTRQHDIAFGKPYKAEAPLTIAVQRAAEIATGKKMGVPGELYKSALNSLQKRLTEGQKTKFWRDPAGKAKMIMEEMGRQSAIKRKYPNAQLGKDAQGNWCWAIQEPDGRWRVVLDEYGLSK